MEGFQINYTDLSDLFWEYKRKIENLIENIDNCIEKINMFTENAVFTGKTGDAVKSYLGEAHILLRLLNIAIFNSHIFQYISACYA